MDHRFKELLVLRDAKENGDGTVLKITTKGDTVIHAISVAREGFSYTDQLGRICLRAMG